MPEEQVSRVIVYVPDRVPRACRYRAELVARCQANGRAEVETTADPATARRLRDAGYTVVVARDEHLRDLVDGVLVLPVRLPWRDRALAVTAVPLLWLASRAREHPAAAWATATAGAVVVTVGVAVLPLIGPDARVLEAPPAREPPAAAPAPVPVISGGYTPAVEPPAAAAPAPMGVSPMPAPEVLPLGGPPERGIRPPTAAPPAPELPLEPSPALPPPASPDPTTAPTDPPAAGDGLCVDVQLRDLHLAVCLG